MKENGQNQAAQIEVLEYPQNVRKRKEMYLPNKDHAVFEIVDNAVDEYAAGRCTSIAVVIHGDEVIIEDDGGGIPITPHKDPKFNGLSQAEVAYTVLHAGGKFGGEGSYKTATGGLHGVGAAVVNALSEDLSLFIKTGGDKYEIKFSKGEIVNNLNIVDSGLENTGTEVHFKLDPEMWGDEKFDLKRINRRIQQLAYLNPGLLIYNNIDSIDKDGKEYKIEQQYCYPEGLLSYLEKLTKNKTLVSGLTGTLLNEEGTEIAIAMAYTSNYSEDIYTFCNNISTEDGGDHLIGFRAGITKAINEYAVKNNIKTVFESEDTREGLVAIVSIKVTEPKFDGQGKSKIRMPEIRGVVRKAVEEFTMDYLDKNPSEAKAIFDKIATAAKAREAAKKARDNARKTKDLVEGGLPGKLADCASDDPEESEIYIVEGDSAAGSAKQGRDRRTQAILPIFGKILNVEKSRLSDVLKNPKLLDMLKAFKCGIAEEFDISKIRYHKIILMSDADVDGAHIQTLNITFFYRYLKPLIEAGYLYIAMPPLYKVEKGKKVTYLYSDQELYNFDKEGASIQRYKGLGEMNPEQLWDTTMNPETRSLIQITIEDAEMAEEIVSICMSENVEPRRDFIVNNALNAVLDI
jgi:DNA gyrase subunit B